MYGRRVTSRVWFNHFTIIYLPTSILTSSQAPKPTDICTICYTSGTTGNPKGVMLTHGNIMSAISASLLQLSDHRPKYSDVLISFLPLAHMLERICEVRILYCLELHIRLYTGFPKIKGTFKYIKNYEDRKFVFPVIVLTFQGHLMVISGILSGV